MIHQTQQQVLHRDVIVLHSLSDVRRPLQGLVHALGNIHPVRLTAAAGHPGQLIHLRLYRCTQAGHCHIHGRQQLRYQPLLIADQGQQQVSLLHLLIAPLHSKALGRLKGLQ